MSSPNYGVVTVTWKVIWVNSIIILRTWQNIWFSSWKNIELLSESNFYANFWNLGTDLGNLKNSKEIFAFILETENKHIEFHKTIAFFTQTFPINKVRMDLRAYVHLVLSRQFSKQLEFRGYPTKRSIPMTTRKKPVTTKVLNQQ